MAKTKRTVEEVEVAAAAAANSDSKLITQSKLSHFATGFWNRIKTRYDGTFKEVELTNDKKLIFTKTDNNTDEINLQDYAKLTDKSEFKKDVSVDDAETKNNLSIGQRINTVDPSLRSFGARNLSSGLFTDKYVSKLRVYLDNAYSESQVAIHVWAIKKGVTKRQDVTAEAKLIDGTRINVEIGNSKKWIDIPINKAFANDTYFIFRTGASVNVEAISNIAQANADHVVNLGVDTPPKEADRPLIWDGERMDTTAYVEIFGRIGIVDLNKKIEKVSADSSLYVKQEETTNTGGATNHNKVVRLDNNGKLNKDMLPSIAINEYFTVERFTNEALAGKVYENGDVAVVTSTGKKYLCINRDANTVTNSITDFIELNSKDGSVVSVNEKTGAVNLTLEATADELKLKITGSGGTTGTAETSVAIVTNDDIDSIIEGLR